MNFFINSSSPKFFKKLLNDLVHDLSFSISPGNAIRYLLGILAEVFPVVQVFFEAFLQLIPSSFTNFFRHFFKNCCRDSISKLIQNFLQKFSKI